MKLVDMHHEPGEGAKEFAMPAMCGNEYPYGLRLNLTMPDLEKLGYTDLPPAGTSVRIEAVATVVRVTQEDPDADGDIDFCCVDLQIRELGIEEEGVDADDEADSEHEGKRADRMYGGKK